ncbi:uncharacterized protein [Blastocystis hominis]|uniref:Uncharacterized protein n=1 Tax=Blastocystis hominis TaxID=12968 RepID=D8M3H2_BLAHO|nr:uncharacterized protein [Blastocystis hominis]CBK22445.2 unnamed protein product [Blastocystis hominis]|eukprot:XP_012896493.1 uncharacterized protein [Blastocystis hominis]
MGFGEQLFNSVKRINRRSVAIRPLHTDSIISLIVNIQRNDIFRHIAFLQKLLPRKFIDALRALTLHSQYNQGSSPSSHSSLTFHASKICFLGSILTSSALVGENFRITIPSSFLNDTSKVVP